MKEEAKGDGDIIGLKTLQSNSRLISLPRGFPLFLLSSARISLPSSPRVCVRASLQRVHREVTNQQQGRDDKAEGAAAAVCFTSP